MLQVTYKDRKTISTWELELWRGNIIFNNGTKHSKGVMI